MLNYKRGQVSETVSWLFATIIIILILLVSIYASSLLAEKVKIVNLKNKFSGDFEDDNFADSKNKIVCEINSELIPEKSICGVLNG